MDFQATARRVSAALRDHEAFATEFLAAPCAHGVAGNDVSPSAACGLQRICAHELSPVNEDVVLSAGLSYGVEAKQLSAWKWGESLRMRVLRFAFALALALPPVALAQQQPQQQQPTWAQLPRMQLERQFAGPLRDTVVQRWRDPADGTICYIYLPISAQRRSEQANASR